MQSVIKTHVRRSDQIQAFYNDCLKKSIGRIKRTFDEEQCTSMILKLGEIAGLKSILPPHSMHDLVKVVRCGLERAGVRVHKCRDPYHLMVEWGGVLKKSSRMHVTFDELPKHATADGGPRMIFNGDRCVAVPMLDILQNPLKCTRA
jgi:hypothetical protein